MLICCTAYAEDKTITLAPGDSANIRTVTIPPGFSQENVLTREDAADVVKALKILLKYAPEKYDADYLTTGTTTLAYGYSGTGVFVTSRKTKADRLRAEADDKKNDARSLREKADALDKEQADIEWARNVLKKWQDKLEAL